VVEPARGQMLMLDLKQRPFAPSVWYQDGYLVPRADGRVLVGSTVEKVGYDKSVTAGAIHRLLGAAFDLFPAFERAPLMETWAGLRPYCERPLIGKTEIDGLLVATGHYRNGILLAPITAELIADLL
jgi:glycine oxidase